MGRSHKSGFHDIRQDDRFPTYFGAELRFSGASHSAIIRDISSSGLLVEGPLLPREGERVHISTTGLDANGIVMWESERCCGILLNQPIKPLSVIWKNIPRTASHSVEDHVVH